MKILSYIPHIKCPIPTARFLISLHLSAHSFCIHNFFFTFDSELLFIMVRNCRTCIRTNADCMLVYVHGVFLVVVRGEMLELIYLMYFFLGKLSLSLETSL